MAKKGSKPILSVISQFMSKVGPPTTTGCRIWTGAKSPNGYGNIKFFGKAYSAHVASAIAFYGSLADGKIVCHKCNNRLCVNPTHLYIGTYRENTHDILRQGYFLGDKKVRLFPEEIAEIKQSSASSRSIAKGLGISHTVVLKIKRDQWNKVKLLPAAGTTMSDTLIDIEKPHLPLITIPLEQASEEYDLTFYEVQELKRDKIVWREDVAISLHSKEES